MINKTAEPPPISPVEFRRRLKLSKRQLERLNALLNSPQRDRAAGRRKLRRLVAELDENLWRGHLYYQPSGPTVRAQLAELETVLNPKTEVAWGAHAPRVRFSRPRGKR